MGRPGSAARSRGAVPSGVDRITVSTLAFIIGVTIFLQRFAVPLGSAAHVPAAFVVGYLGFIWLLFRGRLDVDKRTLGLFLAALSFMTLATIISAARSSLTSFAYLLAIYSLYLFRLKYPSGCFSKTLDIFVNLMTFAAICGMAQFGLQFVLGSDAVFPLDNLVPDRLLLDGYNVVIPLDYWSSTMKSNGVFFMVDDQ